jgi:hypothetical protein
LLRRWGRTQYRASHQQRQVRLLGDVDRVAVELDLGAGRAAQQEEPFDTADCGAQRPEVAQIAADGLDALRQRAPALAGADERADALPFCDQLAD